MQIHVDVINCDLNSTHYWFPCSDMHMGCPAFEVDRWRRDMDLAKKHNARIIANGDVFDGINFKDKRFQPNVLIPDLRGEKDFSGALIRYAFELWRPYSENIQSMCLGNHEEAFIKYNGNDPIARLIERLNHHLQSIKSKHRILHGGISGFHRTTFRFNGPRGCNHDLLRFHGHGGESKVTRGSIDFYRKENEFLFDAITMGHKHQKTFHDAVMIGVTSKNRLHFRERKCIQTGSYYSNYKYTDQENPLDYTYAESAHQSPKPWGGMFLRLRPIEVHHKGKNWYDVKQDVMTEP